MLIFHAIHLEFSGAKESSPIFRTWIFNVIVLLSEPQKKAAKIQILKKRALSSAGKTCLGLKRHLLMEEHFAYQTLMILAIRLLNMQNWRLRSRSNLIFPQYLQSKNRSGED